MKSIGQVNYEAWREELLSTSPLLMVWEHLDPYRANASEAGAKAVLLHALDLLVAAGVTPADAARELRAGKTLEEVCGKKMFPGCECDMSLPRDDRCDFGIGMMRCNGSIAAWQAKRRAEGRAAITNEAFDAGPYPHPRNDDARERGPSFSTRAGLRRTRGG